MEPKNTARLYFSDVMHRRLFPVRYRFVYKVFSVFLNIDDLTGVTSRARLFSYNRFNLFAFYDRDHGPRDGSRLRPWIDERLQADGIDLDGGQIWLLCFPRLLGYVFNPLSLWFCFHRDGRLRAVLCEVKNTFGEQHGYLLHECGHAMDWPVRKDATKCFYVSPFISMDARYAFRLSLPGEKLAIVIREYQENRLMLAAAQTGTSVALNDSNLMRAFLRTPLMTLKVIAMIHWQALKIWKNGAPFYRHSPMPQNKTSQKQNGGRENKLWN